MIEFLTAIFSVISRQGMIELLTDIFQSIVAERWSFLVMRLRSSREPSEEDEGSCPSNQAMVPLPPPSAAPPAAPPAAPSNRTS